MSDGPSVPLWARWGARAVPQVPWAHVRLRGAHGVHLGDVLHIGRGWVSVRVLVSMGYQLQVWRPADVEWETAELMTRCKGIRVELPSGEVHELRRDRGEAVLWRWVARAVEVGATVDGLTAADVKAAEAVQRPGAVLYRCKSTARKVAEGLREVNPKWQAWTYHRKGREPARWVYPCAEVEAGRDAGAMWVPSSGGRWTPRAEPLPLAEGIGPYWYQADAVAAVEAAGGGVVEAPCGAGKTGIGTFLAARVGGRVLVLVHTLDLMTQWVDRLESWLPGVSVGRIGGGKREEDRDIVVASLSTLARWSWDELTDFGSGFGLLVADECHRVPAETWVRVVAALPCTARVGLTATPERKDGLHAWMHLALGPTVYRIEQKTLDDSGRTMAPDIRLLSTGHEVADGDHAADTMRGVLEDANRQALLVGCVRALVERGRRVLVLTSRVDHAEQTAAMVGGAALVGRVSATRRAEVLASVRSGELSVVVATQLADEGLDLPEVDAVVLAAPSSHRPATRQRIGRGCRSLPGKPTPVVVDLRDAGQWATRKARARDALYREMGWQVRSWTVPV